MAETEKRGSIQKWTNYWTGWQTRWLVLKDGILSYYNSKHEVKKGCRCSFKLSACDVITYPGDPTRMDVVSKDDQKWFLRMETADDIQSWLVVIANNKAIEEKNMSLKFFEEIKSSVNELKAYRQFLLQQTNQIKDEVSKSKPDAQRLTKISSEISTTCDILLQAVDNCIISVQNNHKPVSAAPRLNFNCIRKRSPSRTLSASSTATPTSPIKINFLSTELSEGPSFNLSPIKTRPSQDKKAMITARELSLSQGDNLICKKHGDFLLITKSNDESKIELAEDKTLHHKTDQSSNENNYRLNSNSLNTKNLKTVDPTYRAITFFNSLEHSFLGVSCQSNDGIPTLAFLNACEGILPFLNKIGAKAFAPVKIDLQGNIQKLKTKYQSNSDEFTTLQQMIQQEIRTKTYKRKQSATDALLWLKRGLRFIQKFLFEIKPGQKNITVALNKAYAQSLKPYHSYIVGGIFALAVKSAPNEEEFINALLFEKNEFIKHEDLRKLLLKDIEQYTCAMEIVLDIIDKFYQEHNLDSKYVV